MNVAIRVDAGPEIGIGHFMRCLTLANALGKRGASVRFVSGQMPDHLRRLALDSGHELGLLAREADAATVDDLAHSHWLGATQASDAAATNAALADRDWDWVIADLYALDARWEHAVTAGTRRLLAIDDVADRAHDCRVLVDQNLYPDMNTRYMGKVPPSCSVLAGPRYALLREEFAQLRAETGVKDGVVRRMLVLLGGMDSRNETAKAIDAIARLRDQPAVVDVVIGMQHPARQDIAALCDRYGYRCHVQPYNIAELMARADLAIGATGSTSWERCCLGLPTVCFTHAANQVPIAEGLAAGGAIVNLGDGADLCAEDIAAAVQQLIDSPARRRMLSQNARHLVDGLGASRVIDRMVSAA